jgi:hypothetical protein
VWTIPPFIVINQGVGSVKLNCLEATPAAQLIEIKVIGGTGSIVLVLPDGWAVDADRLSKAWGSKTVKVPRDPAPRQAVADDLWLARHGQTQGAAAESPRAARLHHLS